MIDVAVLCGLVLLFGILKTLYDEEAPQPPAPPPPSRPPRRRRDVGW